MGFFITGILQYPNPIDFDSHHVFDKNVLGNIAPASWMGWFYPYFWKFLYDITGNQFIIGVVHNVLYWISISIIYINLFKNKNNTIKENRKYNFWYLIFILYPFAIKLVSPISNNVFVVSFLLLSMVSYAVYNTHKNKGFLIISLLSLLTASFLRREALILVIPIMVYFNFVFFNRKLLQTCLMSVLFLGIYSLINYSVVKKIPNYNDSTVSQSINTIELVTIYDLTVMSYYKNELLIPDSILKPEFQGENRYKIMDKIFQVGIPVLAFEWNPFSAAISPFLQTGTVWNAGLNIETLIPIYIDNVLFYIWLKINMLYGYLIPLVSFLILSIFAMNFLRNKRFQAIFSDDIRSLSWILIISSWIYSIVIILASNSIQYRYVISSTMLIWFVSVFILCQVFTNYKREVVWTKIED